MNQSLQKNKEDNSHGRALKYFCTALLLLNLFACFLIVTFLPAKWKVDIRDTLFTWRLDDEGYLTAPPSSDYGFREYKKYFVDLLLNKHKISAIDGIEKLDTIDKAKKIVLSFSKNGGAGCGANSDNLIKNIDFVRTGEGRGCCSDHSQVFMALAIINGMYPREVSHRSHTFNELYDFERKKWIWIDSQFCLLAKNQEGEYLGLHDIQLEFREKRRVIWEFFGTPHHQIYGRSPEEVSSHYSASEFEPAKVTMGNNVFEEDYYNRMFSFVPREIRQFAFVILGIRPTYAMIDAEGSMSRHLANGKIALAISAVYVVMLNTILLYIFRKFQLQKLSLDCFSQAK